MAKSRYSFFLIFLGSFGPKKKKSTIELLQSKSKLLSCFFDHLVKSKANSATPTNEISPPTGFFRSDNRYPEMQTKLDFLTFVLSNSSLELTNEEVGTLWDVFASSDKEIMFGWLEKSQFGIKDGIRPALTESNLEYLFMQKIILLDFVNLSRAGFAVFEQCFLRVNEKLGKLKRISDTFVALSNDLIGIDNLWTTALDNLDAGVAELAIKLLNSMYQYVNPDSLKRKSVSLREEYLSRCMRCVDETLTASKKEESDHRRILRCLNLVTTFGRDFEAAVANKNLASPRGERDARETNSLQPLTFQINSDRGFSWEMTFMPTDSVRAMKLKIAERYGVPCKQLRFLLGDGREIRDEPRSLQDVRMTDKQKIFVRQKEIKKDSPQKLEDTDIFEVR